MWDSQYMIQLLMGHKSEKICSFWAFNFIDLLEMDQQSYAAIWRSTPVLQF